MVVNLSAAAVPREGRTIAANTRPWGPADARTADVARAKTLGVVDYWEKPLKLESFLAGCDRLEALTGNGVFAAAQLSRSEVLHCDGLSPGRCAVALYSLGDLQGLRNLHKEEGTLPRLGLAYRGMVDSFALLAMPQLGRLPGQATSAIRC